MTTTAERPNTITINADVAAKLLDTAFARITELEAQLAGGGTQVTVARRGMAGRHISQPQTDTKTGTFYRTKAMAGKAVCRELSINPFLVHKDGTKVMNPDGTQKENNFVWYDVQKAAPGRFRDATAEEVMKNQAPVTVMATPAPNPAPVTAQHSTIIPADGKKETPAIIDAKNDPKKVK